MISEAKQRHKYILFDYLGTNVGWFIFTCIRYWFCHDYISSLGFPYLSTYIADSNVIAGQILVPIVALFIYYASGFYMDIFRKTRTGEFISTLLSTGAIVILAYFTILVNDPTDDRMTSYELMLLMWSCLFIPLILIRMIITSYTKSKFKTGGWAFSTLIIGNSDSAEKFVTDNIMSGNLNGYDVKGYMYISDKNLPINANDRPIVSQNEIESFCKEHEITEIIVIPENINDEDLYTLINSILYLGTNIKFPPSYLERFTGKIKISPFINEKLVDIGKFSISNFEIVMKRIVDVTASILALIICSPIILLSAIAIKCNSKGPIFYSQIRIGYRNKPFKIYKLRTMCDSAEPNGPQLSLENDPRITKTGVFLRKYRIDELPQFVNVIKGDMSLVGPRPERQFYINQIMQRDANYALIHSVRPGITSLGMVKYGYASSIDEMLLRMKYDIIYVQNMSLIADFRIILSTIVTVLRGKGI